MYITDIYISTSILKGFCLVQKISGKLYPILYDIFTTINGSSFRRLLLINEGKILTYCVSLQCIFTPFKLANTIE